MKKSIIREDFEGFDVHKRFDVIIDLLYTEDNFELGGKLNAVFGQYGISDADAFLESVNSTFNSILIDLDETDYSEEKKYDFIFAGFNQKSVEQNSGDINKETDEIDGEREYSDENDDMSEEESEIQLEDDENEAENLDYADSESFLNELDPAVLEKHITKFNNLAESFSEDDAVKNNKFLVENNFLLHSKNEFESYDSIKFDEYLFDNYGSYDKNVIENFSQDFEEDDQSDFLQEVFDDEDVITFYVPIILICYRKEKKADFFIFNPFYKKSFVNLWKLNTLSQFAILNNYKDFFFNLKNFYNIKKYAWHIIVFNKQFFGYNFLNSIVNSNRIPITDKIFESYYDYDFNMYFMYWKKAKLRARTFRSYYLKKRKQIASFLKSFKWFSYEILFKFFTLRYVFFDLKSDYNELKKKVLTLYSIMHTFKKKFARKYRRRKSFKRLVFRNKIGIKMTFIRQQFFEKKKKKK